jgi:hypothetical protein
MLYPAELRDLVLRSEAPVRRSETEEEAPPVPNDHQVRSGGYAT